jgi:TM2 domain-containing membrane protein YozV
MPPLKPKAKYQAKYPIKRRGGNAMDDIYTDSASYGRFVAWIGVILGTLVSIALIIVAIWLMTKKEKHNAEVVAVVEEAKCQQVSSGSGKSYSSRPECLVQFKYNITDIPYKSTINTTDKYYFAGSKIPIRYDPTNPIDVTTMLKHKTIGIILLCIGIVLLIVSWLTWYITRRFKFAAAASGIGSAFNIGSSQ